MNYLKPSGVQVVTDPQVIKTVSVVVNNKELPE